MDRRLFLRQGLSAAAAVGALTRTAPARDRDGLIATPIADRLTLICGAGGNVTLFDSPNGMLLVDGGSPERSKDLLRLVKKLTGADRVHTLFNTHWHWDQTGSNTTLGPAGTRIIAHENTRLWLGTDVDCKWQKRLYKRLAPNARPTQTTYTKAVLDFGGEKIEYGYLPQAHTDGDLYVYFRNANVLVAGDVVSVGAYPIIDYSTNGWVGGLANAAQALLDLSNDTTKIVPGKGPVQRRADLQDEAHMLAAMRQRLARLLANGLSAQEMIVAAPSKDFDAKWGDPSLFIENAYPGLAQRSRELGVSVV